MTKAKSKLIPPGPRHAVLYEAGPKGYKASCPCGWEYFGADRQAWMREASKHIDETNPWKDGR